MCDAIYRTDVKNPLWCPKAEMSYLYLCVFSPRYNVLDSCITCLSWLHCSQTF